MKLSNRVFVSTPFETNRKLPLDFPWLDLSCKKGVVMELQGDMNNLRSLQQELARVKQVVNIDANDWGVRLNDLDIKIEFVALEE